MYTRSINYYQNIPGSGWTFVNVRTTDANHLQHLSKLFEQKKQGVVARIDVIKLK